MSVRPPNALERLAPRLDIPRLALGDFPTPVEDLSDLSPQRAGRLWCKREDLSSSTYGGNKVRKLEYLLAAVGPPGAPLVAAGTSGSHHLLACASLGAWAGHRLHAVTSPQAPSRHAAANRRALGDLAEEVVEVPSRLWIPTGVALAGRRLRRLGRSPAIMPTGGSSPLGTIGWVSGGLELAEQVRAGLIPEPHTVWVALGSMGTAAGLLLGMRLGGLKSRLMAVRVIEPVPGMALATRTLALRTLRLMEARGFVPPRDLKLGGLQVLGGHQGRGYGEWTPAAGDACWRARGAGLALEWTYTGKTLAACLQAMAAGTAGREVLFVNTVSSHLPRWEPGEQDQVPSR